MNLLRCFLIILAGMLCDVPLHCQPGPTLAERLGCKAGERLLIVNGDDVGMCHAANVATIEALEK